MENVESWEQPMTRDMVNFSVVLCGLGGRGRDFVGAIAGVPALRLAGCVDLDPARQLPGVAFFTDVTAALGNVRPDVVILALPPAARPLALIEAAFAAAAPRVLLLEKPAAADAAEAQAIAACCRRHGTRLVMGHQLRVACEFVALRDHVAGGGVGRVRRVAVSCVGNAANQGPHMLDLGLWIAGANAAELIAATAEDRPRILAATRPFGPDDLDDTHHPAPLFVTAAWQLANDVRLDLHAGHLAPCPLPHLGPWLQKRVEVEGDDGSAEAHVAAHFRAWDRAGAVVAERSVAAADYPASTRAMLARLADGLAAGDAAGAFADLAGEDSAVAVSAMLSDLARASTLPAPEAAAPADAPGPRFSILLPMADHRGLAERALASWTRDQTGLAAADWEVVVVLSPEAGDLDPDRLRPLLRPQDRLVIAETSSGELEDYHTAALAARGEWLVLTEAHCVAEPDAMAEIKAAAAGRLDGFCAATLDLSASAFAHAEARMYDKGFAEWHRAGDWRKVILRLFAMRRVDYMEAGGFRHRYGRFSEWLLAADLKRRGFRLGYAPKVRIHHTYCDYYHELDPFIRTFTEGECLYRLDQGHGVPDPFFPDPPEWEQMQTAAGAAAVTRCLARLGPLWWRRLPGHLLTSPDTLPVRVALRLAVAKAMTRFTARAGFADATVDRWFVRAYELVTSTCRVRFLRQRKGLPAATPPAAAQADLGTAPPGDLFGFHPREQADGRAFRWTNPVAAVRLALPPGGGVLVLDAHPFLPPSARTLARVALDGRVLAPLPAEGHQLRFALPAGGSTEGWVVVFAPSFPATGDVRRLGLPLAALTVEPA